MSDIGLKNYNDFKPSNREKSKSAKKKIKFWCSRCDSCKVGEFGKCENCGNIENKKKIKYT